MGQLAQRKEDFNRAHSLIDNGCDLIVIDTAHGHSKKVLDTLIKLKKIIMFHFALEILQLKKLQKII